MSRTQHNKGVTWIGIKYGAIAGAIATWAISSAIAGTEAVLGFPLGTFYSIMGISLGLDNVAAAAYVAFGLHIVTGTLLGALAGAIMLRLKPVFNSYRGILAGMLAGLGISIVLFIPVTILLVDPSLQRIALLLGANGHLPALSNGISNFVIVVTNGAIAFHLLWGAIFGYMISSMARIRAYRLSHVGVNA